MLSRGVTRRRRGERFVASLLDALEREWRLMNRSGQAGRASAKWDDPILGRFDGPPAIIEFVQERGHPAENDSVFRPLVQLARHDDLAARTVLHALMPGIRSLVRQYGWASSPDEVTSATVAAALDHIRCYPVTRRPGRIAANILGDTRNVLHRQFTKNSDVVVAPEELISEHDRAATSPTSAHELVTVVRSAVEAGEMSRRDADLIIATRVFGVPINDIASTLNAKPQSLRTQRRRSEAVLAERGVGLSR